MPSPIFTTCDRFGSYSQGSWTIFNDVWGTHKPNTQCLYVNSINSWNVNTIQSNGGVKSYPNTSVVPATPLSQMRTATATYNTASPVSTSGYWWDWTFDVWSSNSADELMIFTSWYPSAGGWGTKIRTNVTIAGTLYSEVWQAAPGWNVLQFIPAQQTNSGTVDVLAVWNWAASQGLLVNTTFNQMQYGVEVTSTNNSHQVFSLNNYSASWSNASGGGSGI